jgi:peptidoglycan/LPS O-acetylase OafA/YrhL
MTSKRIEHIDVWRFFAVLLVIVNHYFRFSGVDQYWLFINTYTEQIGRLGELGVLIFFSISGFVICLGLDREKNATGWICLSAFYTRRFFRIMPPLWLYLTVLMLLSIGGVIDTRVEQIFRSVFFLCNLPFSDGCSWFAGHTWSLGYEEQFYLVYPLLFLWAWQGIKNRRIFSIMGLLMINALVLQHYGYSFAADYCTYFLFLLAGCHTALMPIHQRQRLYELPLLVWILSVILLVGLICVLPNDKNDLLKILCYPFLIQLIVFGTPTHCRGIRYFFHNHTLSYLGRISYSLYLWQQLATAYYADTFWWQTLVYLGLVFGFSILSFRYFEMPCQRLGTRFSAQLKMRNS